MRFSHSHKLMLISNWKCGCSTIAELFAPITEFDWDTRAECERIFESFHRLDSQLPGSGLGLALAREIARAHGGDIGLESEVGKGSRFLVRLPCVSPPASTSQPRPRAD